MGANVRMAPTTHSKNTTAAVNADAPDTFTPTPMSAYRNTSWNAMSS